MNGPEHYAEAERILRIAQKKDDIGGDVDPFLLVGSDFCRDLVLMAQAHASLALTAATIDAASWATLLHPVEPIPDSVRIAALKWGEATS